MRNNVRQGLRVLRRTVEFLEKEITVPAASGPLSAHISALKTVADRIKAMVGEQDASNRASRGATLETKRLSRKLLREFVRPLARMGKLLFPTDATLRGDLKVPKTPVSYQQMLAIAEGIATRVEVHKAKFVEAGFAEDFLEKMRATADALSAALLEKAAHISRRAGATSGLVLEFGRSREMVRMLDDMVSPLLEGTKRLAAWRSVSRFTRVKREETEVQEESPVATGSTPVPSTPAATADNTSPDTHGA